MAALRAAEVPTPDPVGDFAEDMIEEGQDEVTRAMYVPKRVGEGERPDVDGEEDGPKSDDPPSPG